MCRLRLIRRLSGYFVLPGKRALSGTRGLVCEKDNEDSMCQFAHVSRRTQSTKDSAYLRKDKCSLSSRKRMRLHILKASAPKRLRLRVCTKYESALITSVARIHTKRVLPHCQVWRQRGCVYWWAQSPIQLLVSIVSCGYYRISSENQNAISSFPVEQR